MKINYLDAADAEFQKAINYYNEQGPGLGFEFSHEVKEAITRIRNDPEAWTPLSKRTETGTLADANRGVVADRKGGRYLP
jgi:hypothetical protein